MASIDGKIVCTTLPDLNTIPEKGLAELLRSIDNRILLRKPLSE